MNKQVTLLFMIVSIILTSIMTGSAFAQSVPKPSVPQFAIRYVNSSYNVTTTNPYTGLNETGLVSNNSIEITIVNQPFFYSNYSLYYNIRAKPHFADNWTEAYSLRNFPSVYNESMGPYALYIEFSPLQSTSNFTIVTFPANGDIQRYLSGDENIDGGYHTFLYDVPTGGQIDFQVEALVGHASQRWVIEHPLFPIYGGYSTPAVAYDMASDWSNTQTIIIGSTIPEFSSWTLLPLLIFVTLLVSTVCYYKRKP